jgi:predicted lipoprotein with Yx(FWY)xxD motif
VRQSYLLAVAVASAALASGGCGSNSKTTSTASTATNAAAGSTTTQSTPAYSGASSTANATSGAGGVLVSSKHAKLGTILAAGPKKLTVYLFEADKGGSSACSGACAQAWPPVTTSGAPSVGGGAMAADLGTITRLDGTHQVTYKGHPLYYFGKDKDNGDAYGQGVKAFGASWYVLAPSGNKVDKQ